MRMRSKGRKLIISNRHVRHTIATMVQKDPVKALIELITNSDDSYARLEERGEKVSGRITVAILERRGGEPSLLRVTDEAEGFSTEDLEVKLGRMGESTSGLDMGADVRGFFGDGLKEAILGLGVGGSVSSIQGRLYVSGQLYWEEEQATFYPPGRPRPVTGAIRKQLQIPRGKNGTLVEIEVAQEVRIPRHETLQHELALHVALRDIVQNPARTLILQRLTSNGKIQYSDPIRYKDPIPDPAFKTVKKHGQVPGYPGSDFHLEVRRATEELPGVEAGMKRLGGLVVQSRRALVDITFFGHENRPGTEYLFGRLQCDYLYQLLQQGEMVVTKYRAGLSKENEFVRKLGAEVDRLLDPIVQAEAKRLQQSESSNDPQTRKRLDEACRELNRIAREELDLTGPGDEGNESELGPFRFEYKHYRMLRDRERLVRLWVAEDLLDGPTAIELDIDGDGLSANPTSIKLDPADARNGMVPGDVMLTGSTPLENGRIAATLETHLAEAEVEVIELQPREPFSFDQEVYRPAVGHWTKVTLKIQVPQALEGRAEVAFSMELGNVKIRPETVEVDSAQAPGEWLSVTGEVFGEQVGQADELIARMNEYEAQATVVISTERQRSERKDKGGVINRIEFNTTKENPTQRTFFKDGVIWIFVNEPSIRRYLKTPEDRTLPAGRAITAELVLQAFCRYLAPQKAERTLIGIGDEASVDAILRIQDGLIKQYGERIHGIINPR
jgi:hypothetical protein